MRCECAPRCSCCGACPSCGADNYAATLSRARSRVAGAIGRSVDDAAAARPSLCSPAQSPPA